MPSEKGTQPGKMNRVEITDKVNSAQVSQNRNTQNQGPACHDIYTVSLTSRVSHGSAVECLKLKIGKTI